MAMLYMIKQKLCKKLEYLPLYFQARTLEAKFFIQGLSRIFKDGGQPTKSMSQVTVHLKTENIMKENSFELSSLQLFAYLLFLLQRNNKIT